MTSRGTDNISGNLKSFGTQAQRDQYRGGEQQQHLFDELLQQIASLNRLSTQRKPYNTRHPLMQKLLLVSSIICCSSRVRSGGYEMPT